MKKTEIGKNLGYNMREDTIYKQTIEQLNKLGTPVLQSSERHPQCRDCITCSHVYNMQGATVVLEGHHEVEIDSHPHYRYMSFKVFANSSAKEDKLLKKLEDIVKAKEKELEKPLLNQV